MMDTNISITDNQQAQSISIAGSSYRVLVSGEQTNGAYAVIDMWVPPGSGPNPHSHKDMQEMFYVVDGEVEFKMEGEKQIAKKGALINIPFGGKVHCFKNKTENVAHLLCTVIPAGLDSFFTLVGKPIEAGVFLPPPTLSAEEIAGLKVLAEKYGQKLYPPDFLG